MTATATSSVVDDVLESFNRAEESAIDLSSPPDKPTSRSFVARSALQGCLTATIIGNLLVYWHYDPTDQESIRQNYLAIFAILISIGKGYFITQFIHYPHLTDSHLPFLSPQSLHPDCADWFDDFFQAQWRFCPQPLVQHGLNDTKFPEKMIIPVLSRQLLKNGPNSWTWVVTIHKDYNFLVDKDETGTPVTDTFVLKSCLAKDVQYYHCEVGAYKVMNRQTDILPNMARFYGSYRLGQTYNFFLEYVGGGTLDHYLRNTDPPTSAEDILKIWSQILDLIRVVERIHKVPNPNNKGQYLQGIHHDIKPNNILVSIRTGPSKFDVEFKLADLGLANFEPEGQDGKGVHRRDVSGTQMFTPPECWLEEQDPSSPRRVIDAQTKKDIWSLGCVFSIFAVWSVLGKEGLRTYEKNRRTATEKIPELRKTAYSGCFHDGKQVLQAVLHMHVRVHQDRRQHDFVIPGGVVAAIEEMLDEADVRPDATQCYKRFRKILNTAQQWCQYRVNEPPEDAYHPIFRVDPPALRQPEVLPPNLDEDEELAPVPYGPPLRPQSQPPPAVKPLMNGLTNDKRHSDSAILTQRGKESAQLANGYGNYPKGLPTVLELPSTTIDYVLQAIRDSKKRGSKTLQLQGSEYLRALDQREHVFLFDDSTSMRPHWENAKRAFEALGYIVKGRGHNNIEIRFTNTQAQNACNKNRTPLLEVLNSMAPGGNCDIGLALGKILSSYYPEVLGKKQTKIFKWHKDKRDVTVYVLTDGAWSSAKDPLRSVVQAIKNLVDRLAKTGQHSAQVGIEFIQFGNDPKGSRNLKVLDDELKGRGVSLDIVDTEPFMGNVYKMLLGSFNEGWDNPEKKSPSIQSSASLPFPSDPDLRFHKETTGGD